MEFRDPVSSASHLLTAAWAAYATLILIRLTRGDPVRRAAVAVFGVSMVLLYLASGTFHGVPYTRTTHPDEFGFFQKLDQSAIFLLIAGTNTPCLVVLVGGARGRWFLRALWGLAAAGIACLWLLPKAPHAVVVAIYLAAGWLGILPVIHYYRAVGWRAMNWIWLGAGFYTAGAVCELLEWPVLSVWPVRFGFHELLHLCDMGGSVAFFVFVVRYVIPYEPPTVEPEPDAEGQPERTGWGVDPVTPLHPPGTPSNRISRF
jgi:hemolysin III